MANQSSQRQSSSGGSSQEVKAKVDAIQREFDRLESQAQLTNAYETVGRIEERLDEYPGQLKELQRRGFIHTRPLQEHLRTAQGQWRKVSPKVQSTLKEHKNRLKTDVSNTSHTVSRARSGQQSSTLSG